MKKSKLSQLINEIYQEVLNELSYKEGDIVTILDTPAHIKHKQHKEYIGKKAEIVQIVGDEVKLKPIDAKTKKVGMGHEFNTISTLIKYIKK